MNMCRRRFGDGSKALICKPICKRERHIKCGLISVRGWRIMDKVISCAEEGQHVSAIFIYSRKTYLKLPNLT